MRSIYLLIFILSSCATRGKVADDYSQRLQPRDSSRTVVFFLIDGLSNKTLRSNLKQNRLPQLHQHFLSRGQGIMQAHAAFPTLTFTNISSLLRESPVHQTGALGNQIIRHGKLLSFEKLFDRPRFSEEMSGQNIFTRLHEKGYQTVSLDYGLGLDATVSSDLDLNSGLALENQDFLYLDKKRLDSLDLLLTKNKSSHWPEFVFIHLVGLDFISHKYGSDSRQAHDYLETLDQNLKNVFVSLREGEKTGHKVISILSADHGFAPLDADRFDIEAAVENVDPRLRTINEGRMAAIFALNEVSESELKDMSAKILKFPKIETLAFRKNDKVQIKSRTMSLSFEFQRQISCQYGSSALSFNGGPVICPEQLDRTNGDLFYPFFLKNLAYYFQAKNSPDMIIIPTKRTSFLLADKGFHGGPTAEEVLVPLLMRNATLSDPKQIPANWELLKFM